MPPAIEVENLSKQYRIGSGRQGAYRTLRESFSDAARASWKGLRRLANGSREEHSHRAHGTLWALDDVSLDVQPGEVLGVIGRNGAGKSTLLKIISRVTEPTSGRITLRGRLASLLEVGTGFHHELSGRENIFLSGAILGMSKRELAREFDAIVDFAEIDGYLDTPVKRYSSGMLVRLAFAVAAHLNPEILLLDEVLAVGDAGFRDKCIRRMKQLISSGVAVLFVSHQRSQIAEVCQRCVVLHHGSLVYSGAPEMAWRRYIENLQRPADNAHLAAADVADGGRLLSFGLLGHDGFPVVTVKAHEPFSCTISYELDEDFESVGLGMNFFQGNGQLLADCTTFQDNLEIPSRQGRHSVRLDIAGLPFAGGNYLIGVRLYDRESGQALDRHVQRYSLIIDGPADQHAIRLPARWSISQPSP